MFERDLLSSVRAILIFLWGGIALSILAAPYLAAHSHQALAAFLYLAYSPVCHQLPQRSFMTMGACWAVCHRCSGIYLGLLVGTLLPSIQRHVPRNQRKLVMAATAPLALDAVLPLIGIWKSTAASRFVTGLCFGAVLSMLLLVGIAEFLRVCLRQRNPYCSSSNEGVKL